MYVRMYHLRHPGIAAVEVLQELHRDSYASTPVILVQEKGVGNAAAVYHTAQGVENSAHFIRTALSSAM